MSEVRCERAADVGRIREVLLSSFPSPREGELVEAGLAACKEAGFGWAVVLGEPSYYARFGFRRASEYGLVDAYGGGEAFQVVELTPGAVPRWAGAVSYAEEFSE